MGKGAAGVTEEKLVRLNLGCGKKIYPKEDGWINVDFPLEENWSGKRPDVECDLRKLPFADNFSDEIHAIHVIEHFYLWDIADLFKEWQRVMKPGSILCLELPCLDKILFHFKETPSNLRKTWWALYGDPNYKNPHMVHKWAYTRSMMAALLEEVGFVDVQEQNPVFHIKDRDMRFECYKPK